MYIYHLVFDKRGNITAIGAFEFIFTGDKKPWRVGYSGW